MDGQRRRRRFRRRRSGGAPRSPPTASPGSPRRRTRDRCGRARIRAPRRDPRSRARPISRRPKRRRRAVPRRGCAPAARRTPRPNPRFGVRILKPAPPAATTSRSTAPSRRAEAVSGGQLRAARVSGRHSRSIAAPFGARLATVASAAASRRRRAPPIVGETQVRAAPARRRAATTAAAGVGREPPALAGGEIGERDAGPSPRRAIRRARRLRRSARASRSSTRTAKGAGVEVAGEGLVGNERRRPPG